MFSLFKFESKIQFWGLNSHFKIYIFGFEFQKQKQNYFLLSKTNC